MNIAFIPVRGGSKSIPLKNIKPIAGKPLVYWAAKAAEEAKCIDKLVIATDSEVIKSTVLDFGFKKLEVFDRSAENACDTSQTEAVMLEYINKSGVQDEDLFFLVQATSPMLKSEHIDGMYREFMNNDSDSMFTGVLEKQFHWIYANSTSDFSHEQKKTIDFDKSGKTCQHIVSQITKELTPVNYDYRNRPRRQDFVGLIAENGACYINTIKNIKHDKCRLSGKITAYLLPEYTKYEIDEPEDWVIIEELMKRY